MTLLEENPSIIYDNLDTITTTNNNNIVQLEKESDDDNDSSSEYTKSNNIIKFIKRFPGIRYRELMRETGLSNGVLTYHLQVLKNSGRIKIEKINQRVTRYYTYNLNDEEQNLIGFLRQDTTREIILYILHNEFCTFNSIVDYINKVPSTVSWHLSKIKEADIIVVSKKGNVQVYSITKNKQTIILDLIDRYINIDTTTRTRTDKIVNSYIDMMESM